MKKYTVLVVGMVRVAVVMIVVVIFLIRLWDISDKGFRSEQEAGNAGAVLQGAARDLDGIDDACLAEVAVFCS